MPLFEQGSAGGLTENPCTCLSLSWENRMYCFIGCFATALILGSLSLFFLSLAQIVSFSILYTFSNILALSSSLFLVGPMRQLKMMTAKTRLFAFIIYIITLILTLFMAIRYNAVLATIILMIIQFLALLWYW
ncbi:Vesicle transport protein SFT2B [Entomophthora muscae]|uniref:Vesicle transport protein SFT2B n=2 Tax=Entomophthora muscae TaxID=34485 RepID=A0ACC2TK98_9FUNG|nr:Vesicle transport protein SFT2B, variant 2 [Entomophthora muscae]KAJ9075022.1 Vesicle transport protein SFT2B [Entomophthora muscae]